MKSVATTMGCWAATGAVARLRGASTTTGTAACSAPWAEHAVGASFADHKSAPRRPEGPS